jgi:Spherulation-specific family 4
MKRALTTLVGMLAATVFGAAAPLGITVPAYFYPGPLWVKLNIAAGQVPLTAIMNPASGPQAAAGDISNYNSAVLALQTTGGQVIGYVYTSYGSRALVDIKADIDLYRSLYTPIDGFFLDEMNEAPSAAVLAYYQEIYRYIKSKNAAYRVTANPGSYNGEIYLQAPRAADTLVIFENKIGYTSATPPPWIFNYLARNFMHIPWSVPLASQVESYIRLAKSRNTGQIYVTDDDGVIPGSTFTNPWDTLPSYWEQEVQLVKALNTADSPIRLALTKPAGGPATLQINGSPGVYEIQTSENLQQWSTLSTGFTASGALSVQDSSAASVAKKFYRTAQ